MNIRKIGILGSGVVGQTLGKAFLELGYEVKVGTRDPKKLEKWNNELKKKAHIGNFKETAGFGDILVLCTKGTVALEVLKSLKSEIDNKIIIDTTNPIADLPPENGVLKFFTSLDKSLMEELQKNFPSSKFVKAFNSIGNAFMFKPDFKGVKPTMFICGNDQEAKKEILKILEKFGFEIEDMGKAEAARAIEPLCMLWCIPGFLRNEWNHAFKLLKK